MSTDQLSKNGTSLSSGEVKLVKYDEYINRQVEATRRLVKIVDLATSFVVLASGVLAFLLAAAVVEHWLVPGGFPVVVRTILFALLCGVVAYYAYQRLSPLVVRTINPVYAAQAIEIAAATGPSLKNSLINLLQFRQRRTEISDAVYRTLEEQAAQRLSHVPVDAAVDRSLLIRVGYVLLAVVAVASLYKVLSPKDPLIAAQRVLLPWAEIVPASRVAITGVEPGSVTVSRGEVLEVSATVRGLGENDQVRLRFTTEDGQAVNKPVPMKLAKDGLRFEVRLPEDAAATGAVGLAQDVQYRIEAGDARSLDYSVHVVSAPAMLVERVEYEYPAYTNYESRQIADIGDIRAIEGTRVTIHARANSNIHESHVDFDADGRRDVRMATNNTDARATFVLRLRDDRQTPQHASYVLRFTNRDGRPNKNPAKYSIQVEPDVGPEANIRLPEEREVQIRLDETVAIEVDAIDPDFALSEVRLHGQVAGREVLNERLLQGEHSGRFTGRYLFTPAEHELRAGDSLRYWVTANDNRSPQANSATSERKVLRIESPDPANAPPPDRLAQREPQQGDQQQQQGDQRQQQGGEQGEKQQENGQQDGGSGEEGQPGAQDPGAAGGEGQAGKNQQAENGQQRGEESVSRDGQQSGDAGQGDNEEQRQGDGDPAAGGEDASGERQESPRNQQGQDGESRDGQAQPGEQNSDGKQTGAGAADGEVSQGDAQADGARNDSGRGEPMGSGQPRNGAHRPDSAAEPTPVSSEGDNDAEAFERIRRHLQKDGELSEAESDAADDGAGDAGRNAPRSAGPGQENEDANEDAAEEETVGGETAGEEEKRAGDQPEPGSAGDQSEVGNDRTDEGAEGTGAETRDDNSQTKSGEKLGTEDEQTRSPGGEETSSKGPSRAGEEQQPQGAPDSQPEIKPAEKRQQSPSASEQTDSTEPPAGGRGKKDSDSQGEQGGDRAGGGEEGGGQDAPREGTGSAGQNQSAEEGAGQSSEQGAGQDSSNAGSDATADDRTGEAGGETTGRGTKQRSGGGQEPGGAGDEPPVNRDADRDGEAGLGDKNDGGQDGQAKGEDAPAHSPRGTDEAPGRGSAAAGGVGEQGSAATRPASAEGTVPQGDEANLEYARKQTDLVLEKLADQLNRRDIDEELLEELGWSEEDLRQFVERWQSLKESAERSDPSAGAAQRELDEALRSLGLRRGPHQQGPLKEDTLRDLREGYRGTVPLEYQERLRAYNQGVSRARQDDE
jgi:hypothetical protein